MRESRFKVRPDSSAQRWTSPSAQMLPIAREARGRGEPVRGHKLAHPLTANAQEAAEFGVAEQLLHTLQGRHLPTIKLI